MSKTKTKPKNQKEKPKFEPGKSYEWQPDDSFELNGKEFSFLYNMFRQKAEEADQTIAAFNVLQNLFEKGVSEGTIVETKSK